MEKIIFYLFDKNLAIQITRKWKRWSIRLLLACLLLATGVFAGARLLGGNQTSIRSSLGSVVFAPTVDEPCGFENEELYPWKASVDFHPELLLQDKPMTWNILDESISMTTSFHNRNAYYDSWFGTINGDRESYFMFIKHGDTYSGLLGIGNTSFAMKKCGGGYTVALVNPFALPVEEIAEIPDYTITPDPAATCPAPMAGAPVQIDVLVLYTNRARFAAANDIRVANDTMEARLAIEHEILQALESVNLVFSNSHLPIQVRLRHVAAIGSSPKWETQGSLRTTLGLLFADTSVQAMRDTFAADLVCLFVEDGKDAGYANYFDALSHSGRYACSVVRRDCASNNFSLAHEFGHNMGLYHHCDISSQEGEGHGHYFRNSKGRRLATIMSKKERWKRIPFFSDADLGMGTRPRKEGEAGCYSHEVGVLRQTAAIVANYRCAHLSLFSGQTSIHDTNVNSGIQLAPQPQ